MAGLTPDQFEQLLKRLSADLKKNQKEDFAWANESNKQQAKFNNSLVDLLDAVEVDNGVEVADEVKALLERRNSFLKLGDKDPNFWVFLKVIFISVT